MVKSKKFLLSLKVLILFLILICSLFINSKNVFAETGSEDNLYCELNCIISSDNGKERQHFKFKTESEYFAWSKEINGKYVRDYNLYLYKDNSKAFLIQTDSYAIFANNHSFNFANSNGNLITFLSIKSYLSNSLQIHDCPSINPNLQYNVEENRRLEFYNCKINGYGASYYSDVFNIHKGGTIAFHDNTVISNFNLKGNTEMVDFVNEGISGSSASITGYNNSGFVNISAEQKGIMRLDYSEAYVSYLYFNDCDSDDCGGALYINGGKVDNCSFYDCDTDEEGGAIYIAGSNVMISNCTFTDCSSEDDGGAMYIYGTNATINDCVFRENSSDDDSDGGAICVKGDNCTINSCKFYDNYSDDDGGAIYVCASQDNCWINWCTFSGNSADGCCDNIDGNSDTYITGDGAIISNGNVTIIIVISSILVLCAAGTVLFKYKDKLFNKKEKEE